jgi:hypothetical protein
MKKQTIKLMELTPVNTDSINMAVEYITGNKEVLGDQEYILTTNHNVYQTPLSDLIVLSGDTEHFEAESYSKFPLFFESTDKLYVPNKIELWLSKFAPKSKLRDIHKDEQTAIELCLIFIANLSGAFYEVNSQGWKRLKKVYLQEQVSDRIDNTYLKIINLFEEGTKKYGPIIERTTSYTPGQESKRYRLTEQYRNKGVKTYQLTQTYTKNLRRKIYFKILNQAIDNTIANNLIKLYSFIDLPTIEEILDVGKLLVKSKYQTKKGKTLTLRNKHSNDYWNDFDKRSFVEDDIELFIRLTQNGYLIPMVGDAKSGGRVVDSFVLMPSWIRNLIKINGKSIQEADFSALHPNIAMTIYGGTAKYITHQQVSEETNISLKEVKIEHLSFFNKPWTSLYHSPLFNYYKDTQPDMMSNMYHDKTTNGYKITSRKMSGLEVKIMTQVIKQLNSEGIIVGYVYDALFSEPKHHNRIAEVMNQTILTFNVYTKVK